ncbi:LuxR family transcriptional regulator [Streptomyces cyaneofuscatus]|uniref:LuxR family transcriptional regulator n=1 Tax=Streptomyces cyaneofuscatus TaxID=66883 RepID=A0ABZ1F6B9_9ACTN|nr:LuxR family transcriptional regulator [Streptomyces cyaneofuscatus]WSB11674.1 LuxR family transcriptional regulator [Streptomyces cyaneofuscatus]WSD44793.1 LuxR family transcriptional regulator [Streptomyces cyaneofuscatus]
MGTHTMSPLGLSSTEERVYRFFLRNPGAAVRDARTAAPMDGEGVHRAAARLRDRGLLHGSEARTWATDPGVVVARLAEEQLDAAYRTLRRLADPRPILRSLWRDVPAPSSAGGESVHAGSAIALDRLEDLGQALARIDRAAFQADAEILAAVPDQALVPLSTAHTLSLGLRCLRRGVRVRALLGSEAPTPGTGADHLRRLRSHGAEVRVAQGLSELVLVYDRRTALVPVDAHDIGRGVLCIEESGLVSSLVTLFERLWAAATDLADRPASKPGTDTPTGTQRTVLLLMCTATKDEAGARAAGMSLRTYRRHVSDLLALLGACSRAQAALLARERGWV